MSFTRLAVMMKADNLAQKCEIHASTVAVRLGSGPSNNGHLDIALRTSQHLEGSCMLSPANQNGGNYFDNLGTCRYLYKTLSGSVVVSPEVCLQHR
jgi:hypothetical protein